MCPIRLLDPYHKLEQWNLKIPLFDLKAQELSILINFLKQAIVEMKEFCDEESS